MNETAQERARAIWRYAKNNPSPVGEIHTASLILEDYQAHGEGGHWAHVSCLAHEDIEKVMVFIQGKTSLSRWIVRVGSPYWRDGKWNWQLIR
jgi:hypothetical protein